MPGKLIREERLPSGARFEAVVYDLLFEATDVIVNAANGGLSHGGGVAAAIADAAGPELIDEGNDYVARHGRLAVGQAVLTTAGRLPFRGVIHAVGPRLGDGDEEAKIVRALHAAFSIAEANGFGSLSFPALSSGIFAVPIPACVRAYLAAVRTHFVAGHAGSLERVRLCVFGDELTAELKRQP